MTADEQVNGIITGLERLIAEAERELIDAQRRADALSKKVRRYQRAHRDLTEIDKPAKKKKGNNGGTVSSETVARVLEAIRRHPDGTTVTVLMEETDLSNTAVTRAVRDLREEPMKVRLAGRAPAGNGRRGMGPHIYKPVMEVHDA